MSLVLVFCWIVKCSEPSSWADESLNLTDANLTTVSLSLERRNSWAAENAGVRLKCRRRKFSSPTKDYKTKQRGSSTHHCNFDNALDDFKLVHCPQQIIATNDSESARSVTKLVRWLEITKLGSWLEITNLGSWVEITKLVNWLERTKLISWSEITKLVS